MKNFCIDNVKFSLVKDEIYRGGIHRKYFAANEPFWFLIKDIFFWMATEIIFALDKNHIHDDSCYKDHCTKNIYAFNYVSNFIIYKDYSEDIIAGMGYTLLHGKFCVLKKPNPIIKNKNYKFFKHYLMLS